MLVAFEGQDAAGKSTLLAATHAELGRRSVGCAAVDEFSESLYGRHLVTLLRQDKFLRSVPGQDATALTRALEVIADLYYFDERVLRPLAQKFPVVLKDRHVDSVVYTLVPSLLEAGAFPSEDMALDWVQGAVSGIRLMPHLVVYVHAPVELRHRRITERARNYTEHDGDHLSVIDCAVLGAREQLGRLLIQKDENRYLVMDTGKASVELRAGSGGGSMLS